MSTALIYVRQSRQKVKERTVSPEVQEAACRALPPVAACDEIAVFIDLNRSGKSAQRPEFQSFLRRLQDQPPAVVAVYDQSRSFRNTAEALDFFALMERMPQITVALVYGSFDRTPTGEFSYTTLAAAHTMERKMVAAKMRDAVRFNMAQGRMVGQTPAGYVRVREGTDYRIEIDEQDAEAIRLVFNRYITGRYTVRTLAVALNDEGVKLSTLEKDWTGDTVAQILANHAYAGKTFTEDRRLRRGEMIDGDWPPIIDMETWRAAERQRRLRGPGGRKQDSGKPSRYYVYQRLLRCTCGRRLHAQTSGHLYRYYRCDACNVLIREEALIPWGDDLIRRLAALQPADFADAVAGFASSAPRSPDALDSVNATLDRVGKRFEWGHITEADYQAEHERLTALREEIMAVELAKPPVILDGIQKAWDTGDPQTRRELLGELFDELDVRDGEIVGYKPRSDRAVEVAALLDLAYGSREGSSWTTYMPHRATLFNGGHSPSPPTSVLTAHQRSIFEFTWSASVQLDSPNKAL